MTKFEVGSAPANTHLGSEMWGIPSTSSGPADLVPCAKEDFSFDYWPNKIDLGQSPGATMQPLLSFYSNVDLETASIHAATLEEVTYAKVMKNGARQGASRAKNRTNAVLKWAGLRHRLDDKPAKTTAEIVVDRSKHWNKQQPSAARREVFNQLATKLNSNVDDLGTLSRLIIEEAAEGMNISNDLLLSQQAEAVADAYMKECIKGLQEFLRKQDRGDAIATESLLSQSISEMTQEQKLEMQQSLGLKELSGKAVRDTFVKSGAPLAGIAAVQASGFGAYLALSTVMHAVFTGILGITLPFAAYTTAASTLSVLTGPVGVMLSLGVGALGYFWGQRKIERSQCAMIVFACVCASPSRLSPNTLSLPSAKGRPLLLGNGSESTVEAHPNEIQDFRALSEARESSERAGRDYRQADADLASEREKRRATEKRLASANELLSAAREQIITNNSLQTAMSSQISSLLQRVVNLTAEANSIREEIERKVRIAAEAEEKARIAQTKHEMKLESEKTKLRQLWAIHFPLITFDSQPLRWAAEQDFPARLEIERALKELAEADDPVQLSRSRMHKNGEHHSGFTIPVGVPCRIFFTAKGKNVSITKMCKRKDC